MTESEYTDVTTRVLALAGLSMRFEPEQLLDALRAIQRADTVAPILSPTAYGAGVERMHALANVLRATLKLREAAERFEDVVAKTEPKVRRAREDAAAILGVRP